MLPWMAWDARTAMRTVGSAWVDLGLDVHLAIPATLCGSWIPTPTPESACKIVLKASSEMRPTTCDAFNVGSSLGSPWWIFNPVIDFIELQSPSSVYKSIKWFEGSKRAMFSVCHIFCSPRYCLDCNSLYNCFECQVGATLFRGICYLDPWLMFSIWCSHFLHKETILRMRLWLTSFLQAFQQHPKHIL